jgi:hypothetical protein
MSVFFVQHPDSRYWSTGANNQVILGSTPSTYEFHDGTHIRNCDNGMCIRHSYWVLFESLHDNTPEDFEWTITTDGQIVSTWGGSSNVVPDGDGLKIVNDGSTMCWNVIYKKNRFCLCSDVNKCTCNDPVTPVLTQPLEEIVGVQEPLDIRLPEVQKIVPPEIVQKLVPPELIIPEVLQQLSSSELLPEVVPEIPSISEPASEVPAPIPEVSAPAPETPLEPPAQPEN